MSGAPFEVHSSAPSARPHARHEWRLVRELFREFDGSSVCHAGEDVTQRRGDAAGERGVWRGAGFASRVVACEVPRVASLRLGQPLGCMTQPRLGLKKRRTTKTGLKEVPSSNLGWSGEQPMYPEGERGQGVLEG